MLGGFLRLYRIDEFATFLGDQGRDAIIVKRIITFEHFPAIGAPSSIGQIYLGPFYYYLIAPFLLLTKFNPVGLSIGVGLLSILGTILSYYIIKKEVNAFVAFFFLLLVAFSFPLIELARFSWNPNLLPYFSFFTIYFFYKLMRKSSSVWALLFGAFLSFSIQLHHLALFLTVPFFIMIILDIVKNKELLLERIKYLGISFGSFLFFSIPLIIFDLKHDFLNTKNFITLLTKKEVIGKSSYLLRLTETVQGFFHNLFQIPFNGFISILLLIALVASSYVIFKKLKSNSFILLHFLNVFCFIICFALLNSERHIHYFGTIYISFFLIIAYIVYELSMKNKSLKTFLPVVCITIFLILNIKNYYYFQKQSNNQIRIAKTMADSFQGRITSTKFQMVSIPPTDTDGHIRYFLEIQGHKAFAYDSMEQAEELFALCFKPDCVVIGDPQWQIASFENKKIDQVWKTENVTIYKLVHGPKE